VRFLFLVMFLLLAPLAVQAAEPPAHIKPEPITVDNPADLEDLNALRAVIAEISQSVTACMDAGGNPQDCQCQNYNNIKNFNVLYLQTLAAHPEWEGKIVFQNSVSEDGYAMGISTSFAGLQSQYEANHLLKCP
jgi:hypothetical protein